MYLFIFRDVQLRSDVVRKPWSFIRSIDQFIVACVEEEAMMILYNNGEKITPKQNLKFFRIKIKMVNG